MLGLFVTRFFVFNNGEGIRADRPDVPNVIVLLTDVVPDLNISELVGVADGIKASGAPIIGIEVANTVCIPIMLNTVA